MNGTLRCDCVAFLLFTADAKRDQDLIWRRIEPLASQNYRYRMHMHIDGIVRSLHVVRTGIRTAHDPENSHSQDQSRFRTELSLDQTLPVLINTDQ